LRHAKLGGLGRRENGSDFMREIACEHHAASEGVQVIDQVDESGC
jgi:hypothetical protein